MTTVMKKLGVHGGMTGWTAGALAVAMMLASVSVSEAANYTWNGGDSGVWQTGGSGGWLNIATPVAWADANIAIFAGASPKNITISGTVAPSGFTVNSGAGDYTFTGGTLDVTGTLYNNNSAGTLTLATAVTQIGATFFVKGAYALDASGSLGGAYTFTLGYGAVTATMTQSGNVTIGSLYLGSSGNANATWTASGGILTATDVRIAAPSAAGHVITGVLDVNGATVNTPTIYISYGTLGTATATLKLRSGTIAANSIYRHYSAATSAFELSGGTLKPYNNTATYGSATAANNNDITLSGSDGTISSTDKDGAARTVNIYSAIGESGGRHNLTFAGAGTNILYATNTYSGSTVVSAGTLLVSSALALQNSTLTNTAAGTVKFGNGITSFTLGGLSGLQNMGLTNTGGTAITLTVGNNSNTTTYAGVLSGGGSLVKVGTGTLTLTNANTYTGSTTVSNGTLNVNGSHSGSGTYTVETNAVLIANGSVSGHAVTVNNGGTIGGTGTVAISSLTLNTGSKLRVTILDALGHSDSMTISGGTLDVNGLALNVVNTNLLTKGQFYRVVTSPHTGAFFADNLPSDWKVDYTQTGYIQLRPRALSGTLLMFK